MSIFVTSEDVFDVVIYHKIGAGKVEVSKETKEGYEKFSVVFKRPSFGVVQNILKQSTTVNTESGLPVVNYLQMQTAVLFSLIVSWDVKDKDGGNVPLNNESLSELRPEIARGLIENLYEKLGPGGII